VSDDVQFPQYSADGLPITYVPNPYSADGKPADGQWKNPVRVHTTGPITLSGLQSIDSVSVMEGDRVLVKDQVNAAENGIYVASAGNWLRASDCYLWEQFVAAVVAVEEGSTGSSVWLCDATTTGTVGVTPNHWAMLTTGTGTLGAFTPLRAIVSDALGNPAVSPTTSQEIAYVSGVTSSVQQQLNAISNEASSAFSIAVDGTNAAANAQSTANSAQSTANSAYALAQNGTNVAAAAYTLAQIGTNTGTAAYQLAQTGSNVAYDAYAIAVTGTTIGSLAYGLATSLGNKYVRTTRFASIGAGTSGAVTLPANSTVVLDDFGGGVDAVITTISAGYPTFSHAFTAAGDIVTTSFDAGGNYTLSGAPSAYPVALIYRVRQTLSDFDSTSTDIIGDYDVESVDGVVGTPNQVYANGSTSPQFGIVTLSLPQDIGTNSSPTFNVVTATGSVYSPNIEQTTQVAYSGSNVAWAAWELAQMGTQAGAGTDTYARSVADAAWALAQIGTNTGTAALDAAATALSTANDAYTIAVIGTNTGSAAYSVAQSAWALAQIGTNTGTAALDAAASAQSTADSAYFIAQVGTNTGTAAYTLAESGSSVAWAAWELANYGTELPQSSYDLALAAYHLAQIGTNTGTAALDAAGTAQATADAAYLIAVDGTNAAASAQSTADTAYFIAQVGTNTGTAAYTLAESGSNVAWSAWLLANYGTELPQSSYDLALAAYHLAQIGTNTGTAALDAAASAQSTADSAFSIAVIGTNAAASAQSTADAAYLLAQIGTNTGSAAYSYAAAAYALAQTGTNSIAAVQSTANTAYAIAQIGTNTGSYAVAYAVAAYDKAAFGTLVVSSITSGTTLVPAAVANRAYLADTTSGDVVVALPNALGWSGEIIHAKKTSGESPRNNLIVRSQTGSQTIDNALSYTISVRYQSIQVTTDGVNWYII